MAPDTGELMKYVRVLAAAVCIQLVLIYAPGMLAQAPVTQPAPAPGAQAPAPGRGRGPIPVDSRAQIRMHHFADTNEDIPYALFISSKIPRGCPPMMPPTGGRPVRARKKPISAARSATPS